MGTRSKKRQKKKRALREVIEVEGEGKAERLKEKQERGKGRE